MSPHAQASDNPSSPLHGLFNAIGAIAEDWQSAETEHADTLGIGEFPLLVDAQHAHAHAHGEAFGVDGRRSGGGSR